MKPNEAFDLLFLKDTKDIEQRHDAIISLGDLVTKVEKTNEKLKKLVRIIDSQISMYDGQNKPDISGALGAIKQIIEINLLEGGDEE